MLGVKLKELLLFDDDVQEKKPNLKHKGQRKAYGCMISKDIGCTISVTICVFIVMKTLRHQL